VFVGFALAFNLTIYLIFITRKINQHATSEQSMPFIGWSEGVKGERINVNLSIDRSGQDWRELECIAL
jgi:hypothetical protein